VKEAVTVTQSLVVCIPLMMMMLCVTLCCMRSDSICVNVDTHLTHCGTSSSSRAHYTMHLMHYVSRCTVKTKTGLQSWSKIVDVSHWVPRTIPGHQADDKECLMIKMSWYDQLMTVGCHSMIWLLTTDACTQKLSFSALIQLVGSFDV